MKINYLKYCTFFVLYLITTTLPAQNYIYNGGFESGNTQGAYDASIWVHHTHTASNGGSLSVYEPTSNYLDTWERATDDLLYHNPDWWRKGIGVNFFTTKNVNQWANATSSYSEVFPHTGYGMLGLSSYELIQQQFNVTAFQNAITASDWKTITLKFWIRPSNQSVPSDLTLKVYMASGDMKYKDNSPHGNSDVNNHNSDSRPTSNTYCSKNYKKYRTISPTYREEIISIENVGVGYPRGQWHLIERTIDVPSNINHYDWIMFDLNTPEDSENSDCGKGYLFIDDIELSVGCPDDCSATDGPLAPHIPSNFIASNNLFVIDNIQNASSVRLELYTSTGAIAFFDETISCMNGIDHPLYWDGTLSGGTPIANANYFYRITIYNDCGEKKFEGKITKFADYTGSKSTNFNVPCTNGVNPTPEPCCWIDPNMYINNTTLIGPDPSWSKYIIPLNIWACTDQSDFSDWVKVEHDAKVLFRAGRQVTLREGFHTERGATFCAEIKPCPRPKDTGRGENTDGGARFSDPEEIEEVVETPELVNGIKVYPNPTTGLVNIDLSTFYVEDKIYQLSIYNVLGERLQSFEVNASTLTVQLHGQPEGIYLIEISDGIDRHIVKLIKS